MSIRGAAVAWGLGVVCAAGAAGRAQGAVLFHQTVDVGQVGQGSVFEPASPITSGWSGYVVEAVFAGSRALPLGGGEVTGAGMGVGLVDLGNDHTFRYTIEAPAGEQFRVSLPEGALGFFSFNVHLGAGQIVPGVTLTPAASVGFEIDGVSRGVQAGGQGVDPHGSEILMEGRETGSHGSSFTFRTLSFTLDYSVDGNGTPLDVVGVAKSMKGLEDAYVEFSTSVTASQGDPAPGPLVTMEAVPEPGMLGMVGMIAVSGLGRRRRTVEGAGCHAH